MTRIAHISDIHFGRISNPDIVNALIGDVNRASVDLVVASGDLTQRAFGHQFRAAKRMLEAFDAPHLVVPGNHDVYPWWRLYSRLFAPLRRYKKLISSDLAPRIVIPQRKGSPEIIVQGINSAFGWTIQGGKITTRELDQVREGFAGTPADAFRILVVHHHLAELELLGTHDLSKGAHEAFAVAHEMNVDLILCGHLHISHVAHVSIHEGAHPIVVATSGTSTSSRGRGEEPLANYFNLVEIGDASFKITEKRFDAETGKFLTRAVHDVKRAL